MYRYIVAFLLLVPTYSISMAADGPGFIEKGKTYVIDRDPCKVLQIDNENSNWVVCEMFQSNERGQLWINMDTIHAVLDCENQKGPRKWQDGCPK